ncbi:MAG: 16S rRNA (uracil(1498)-N(3))-methyltransferase [Acidobacteriota bacterium]
MHRFFAPSLDPGDETAILPREEGEHLTRVLRLTAGDTVAVFDGRGHEFLARVIGSVVDAERRRAISVQLLSRIEPAAEPAVALTLVQAVLKADKMDDIVRDAVMLGAAAIHPIITNRTEVTVAAVMRGARLDRWRRVALASVKQSRRATLPEIRMPLGFEDFLDEPPTALRLMLVEPSASADVESIGALRDHPIPGDAAVLVGPEGGWTQEECAMARARGVRLICLGHRTLRADAAPIAAISVLQFLWNDL